MIKKREVLFHWPPVPRAVSRTLPLEYHLKKTATEKMDRRSVDEISKM